MVRSVSEDGEGQRARRVFLMPSTHQGLLRRGDGYRSFAFLIFSTVKTP